MARRFNAWAALLLCLSFGAGVGCASESLGTDEPGLDEDVGLQASELRKGNPLAKVGDSNYCGDPSFPCDAGEGDCDGTFECASGLVCGRGKGKQFVQGKGDACVPAHCVDKQRDADETQIDCGGSCGTVCPAPACNLPLGSSHHCSTDCLCGAGEGDCATNQDCIAPLVCGFKKGRNFGLGPAANACVPPHCTNQVWDADELGLDCGNSCGACQSGSKCVADEQCPAAQSCVGSAPAKLCVPPTPRCSSDAECAAGSFCDGGACHAAPAAGEPCSPGGRCDKISYCFDGICAPALRQYEPCYFDVPCEVGTSCRQSLFGISDECLAPGDTSRCYEQADCLSGMFCGAMPDGISRCKGFLALGQKDCNVRLGPLKREEFHCGPGLYCKNNGTTGGICAALPASGARCTSDSYGQYARCAPGLYCDPSGRCLSNARLGADCSARPCLDGLACLSGVASGVCQ
jgi:hypothetical protein